MDMVERLKLPIEQRLELLRAEEALIEEYRKAGSPVPVTDGMIVFEEKIRAGEYDYLRELRDLRQRNKRTSWKKANPEARKVHNRKYYLKKKNAQKQTENVSSEVSNEAEGE